MQYDLPGFSGIKLASFGSDDDIVYRNDAIYMPITLNDLRIRILDLRQVRHRKDWVSKPHRHPWYEFNYVSEGSVFTCIDGTEFLAEQGSFFLVPPQAIHSHRHNQYCGDGGFCLRFVTETVQSPEENALPVADRVTRILQTCPAKLFRYPAGDLLRGIEQSAELQFPGLFAGWLMDICTVIAPDGCQERQDGHEARKAGLVRQIELYLESFFAEAFVPEEFARSLNYSYRHLSRVYKQATGRSITAQLSRIRIQRARQLLADPTLTLWQVSQMTGFASYAAFLKTFEELEGCAPSRFRKTGG